MNQLTDSAKESLVAAARMVGEPGAVFATTELVIFEQTGSNGYAKPKNRSPRGMRSHTLPALERRGYVKRRQDVGGGNGWWTLTDRGFELAMEISGGRGLL